MKKVQTLSAPFLIFLCLLYRRPCVVEGDDDAVFGGDLVDLGNELGCVDVQELDRERLLLPGAHGGEDALDDLLGKLGRRADALADEGVDAFAFGQDLYQIGQESVERFGIVKFADLHC